MRLMMMMMMTGRRVDQRLVSCSACWVEAGIRQSARRFELNTFAQLICATNCLLTVDAI